SPISYTETVPVTSKKSSSNSTSAKSSSTPSTSASASSSGASSPSTPTTTSPPTCVACSGTGNRTSPSPVTLPLPQAPPSRRPRIACGDELLVAASPRRGGPAPRKHPSRPRAIAARQNPHPDPSQNPLQILQRGSHPRQRLLHRRRPLQAAAGTLPQGHEKVP